MSQGLAPECASSTILWRVESGKRAAVDEDSAELVDAAVACDGGTETKRVDELASSVVPEPRLIMCVYAQTAGGCVLGGGLYVCV